MGVSFPKSDVDETRSICPLSLAVNLPSIPIEARRPVGFAPEQLNEPGPHLALDKDVGGPWTFYRHRNNGRSNDMNQLSQEEETPLIAEPMNVFGSMLCLTCQQGLGSSGNGIDAGVGAYQGYLNAGRSNNAFCSPQMNKTLPADVQSAVCNKDIKIYDDLYNIFWGDGAWFYIFTSQTITKDQAADPNKVFTKCPAKTSSSSSTSPTASSSSTGSPAQSGSAQSESESSGLGTGAIAGIAVGIVALVIAGALGAFFFFKRRKRTQYVGASGFSIDGSQGAPGPLPNPYPYTPTTVSHHPPPASSASGSTSQYFSSQPPMTSTGSYFPASASAASYGVAPQHSASGGTSQSGGSGHGSSSAYGSNAGFVVSNPDGGRGGGGASGSMPNPYSPQSPRSPPPLPGKGAAPNAGMTYVPAAPSSQADSSERHLDAGPVGGSSLQRNTSGRLPPAYGDLMRDSS
ncbi:hypothetical protein PQX77_011563 [Marasmius sp. AFHP31]|nr:hypothetical protein PQX77_011563 [Marasmius sp. AFHP31]